VILSPVFAGNSHQRLMRGLIDLGAPVAVAVVVVVFVHFRREGGWRR